MFVLNKNNTKNDEYEITKSFNDLPKLIKAGDIVGKIQIIKDGNVICETNLISQNDYKSATYFDAIHNVFDNWNI